MSWANVKKLEALVDDQNPQPLLDFVRMMADRKLLNRHMLVALCDTSLVDRRDEHERWELLHELADVD